MVAASSNITTLIANVFRAYLTTKLEAGGSETTIYIDRVTTLTGETISTSDFADFSRGVIAVNPDGDGISSYPEYISFTAVSGLTLTGAVRGLSAKSNSVVAANKRFHPDGTPVILSFGSHTIQDILDYIDAQIGALTLGANTVSTGTAGEDLTAGQLAYLKNDGKWWKTDADTAATLYGVILGIVQSTTLANATITSGVLQKGLDTNQTGLVAGTEYFASNTAGGIGTSSGTNSKKVGVARSTTNLYFDPSYAALPTDAEADFLEDLKTAGIIFGGDGSDGVLNVTSGTTTLDLSVKTVWQYTSITIAVGATLNFSGGTAGDKIPVLKCQGNFSNEGTITTVGLGVVGGTGGAVNTAGGGANGTQVVLRYVDTTLPEAGKKGNGAVTTVAGTGGAAAAKNATYFAPYALNGSGGAGGGGGTSANVGTPGAGGAGGAGSLGLYIEILGNFTNTGSINLNGVAGTQGGNAAGNGSSNWTSGGGGGGGGGGAGSLILLYKGTYTNSGTITTAGGAAGDGGPRTNYGVSGGSPTYGAGGGGGSGGATSFNSSTAGANGLTDSAPNGGAGSAGGDGIKYLAQVR